MRRITVLCMLVAVSLTGCLGDSGGQEQTPPEATRATPGSGPAAGGTTITVFGTGFEPGATAMVDGRAATVQSVTPTSVRIQVPAGTIGSADVTITNPDGTATTLTGAFTYLAPVTTTTAPPPPPEPACRVWVSDITSARFAQGAATPRAHWRVFVGTDPEAMAPLGAVVTAEIQRITSDGELIPGQETFTEAETVGSSGHALFNYLPTSGFGNFRLTVLSITHEGDEGTCDYDAAMDAAQSKDQNLFI